MTRIVGRLLLLNLVAYAATSFNRGLFGWLALVPVDIVTRPWTLVTYMFLHDPGGIGHIFFNMLGLFFFGPKLEARLGSRRFLRLYLTAGLVGAMAHIAWMLASMRQGGLYVPMVGASAAVYGVLFAYARYWPRDRVLIWFVIPVQVRYLVIAFTLISLWSGLGGVGGGVAHFAHLGGFLGGWLYLRVSAARSPAAQFRKRAQSPGARMGDRELNEQWRRIDPAALHPANRDRYERISQKMRSSGWTSLSERERAFVHRFGGGLR